MDQAQNQPALNTDRELWREKKDDYYAPSIHVTQGGGIGMNVGGHVIVLPVRDWHRAALERPIIRLPQFIRINSWGGRFSATNDGDPDIFSRQVAYQAGQKLQTIARTFQQALHGAELVGLPRGKYILAVTLQLQQGPE
jgi:hypothetical protein